MPMYEYHCEEHGKFSRWSTMGARHDPQECPCCGRSSTYTISAPRVFSDFEPYVSPASGRVIEGRKARIEDFARTGTRPYEIGEMQDAARKREQAEKQFEARIDETVEKTFAEIKK